MGLKQKTLAIVGGFLVIFEAVFEAIFWGALVFVAVDKSGGGHGFTTRGD